MFDLKKAQRLLEVCLPALQQSALVSLTTNHDDDDDDDDDDWTTRDDIQVDTLCRLWGGMGHVYRMQVKKANRNLTIIVKHVSSSSSTQGTRLSVGDQRKADSYECEANFYQRLAPRLLTQGLEIPIPLHIEREDGVLICMSELKGNSLSYLGEEETKAVLRWLATLHAATWGPIMADQAVSDGGLQPNGTYWYLDTRLDEHASIRSKGWEGRLKRAARAIDERLKRDPMQCCVHGDAKSANMLFRQRQTHQKEQRVVGMYDFQYCGKAPPTKDLAYMLCVAADDINDSYVDYYHEQLSDRLPDSAYRPSLDELKESLDLAFCDWARFMAGWGYWGTDVSTKVIAVLDRLDGGNDLGSEDAYREAVMREYG